MAYFVMSFADLCALVLRKEPAEDRYQEIINAHTKEDGNHWEWYLEDLARLGVDHEQSFSNTLRFIWGPDSEKSRLLTYRLCGLGLGANSLRKLVLLKCVEATAKVGFESTSKVAREIVDRNGKPLLYLGAHHLEAERDHTLSADKAQRLLEGLSLDEKTRQDLQRVVEETFDAFTDFVNELFRFASSEAKPGPNFRPSPKRRSKAREARSELRRNSPRAADKKRRRS
jgi:hypothetical protein